MKKLRVLFVLLVTVGLFVSFEACAQAKAKTTTVKLGIIGDDTDVWDTVKKRVKKAGIDLVYVKFSDYNQPNQALSDGSIDLNAFQHKIFLENYNQHHHTTLVSIGNTENAPMGIYSEKVTALSQLKTGAKVAIPNDVTNGGRALLLLQTAGLIQLAPAKDQAPTIADIRENKKKLRITELDASQTARALADVSLAVINSGVAVDAGFNPKQEALYLEPVDEKSRPYVNIIVARKKDAQKKAYQKIVQAYQSKETEDAIKKTSKGSSFAAWETFGRI